MGKPLTERGLEEVAEFFRALGDPMRLRILHTLRGGEASGLALSEVLDTSQPTMSRHLTALERRGVLKKRRDGVTVYYSIRDRRVFDLCDLVCTQIETGIRDRQKLRG